MSGVWQAKPGLIFSSRVPKHPRRVHFGGERETFGEIRARYGDCAATVFPA